VLLIWWVFLLRFLEWALFIFRKGNAFFILFFPNAISKESQISFDIKVFVSVLSENELQKLP
jgi:hypothetical protein